MIILCLQPHSLMPIKVYLNCPSCSTRNGGQKIEIVVKGITNPSRENDYYLTVFTSKQTKPSVSAPYHIGVSSISDFVVTPDPVIAGEIATYAIEFRTGVSGELNPGDTIVLCLITISLFSHKIALVTLS